ncbi:Peptidyl-arginine deiminase, Porphyromonas-type [Cordyceps fumosorosea ARSEF 2679]|uniref:Peptidyl-arginine deiminase, Porphyromonas-type n=1 Tax=Cordyceps fumosorosea (strain ARSEF 2679) TaxID=1081104 RepID=A0A167R2I6_CORFA|nr:Peptidyl-arginine deiminase, Porphyromonas-type [Cordyceps fumosorosea ARSEF 2679]OAA58213.1 Peptidyl-arginine deiminase, Porphyromonas-type [Cordyceps fumosorosea ARSEF 2679]
MATMAHLATANFFRPAEWHKHSGVIMAWPAAANDAYRDDKQGLRDVTKDISTVAEAVALFEPVTLVVVPERLAEAEARFRHPSSSSSFNITLLPVDGYPKLDLWMRDMAPTFVVNDDDADARLHAVDFNFNGWGHKYPTDARQSLARTIAGRRSIPVVPSWLVTEGGSLEVDGDGTLLITESSVLIENRNPGRARADVEAELRRTLGVETIVWLPGRRGLDITDGHVDGLARFVAPGRVLLSRPSSTDDEDDPFVQMYREARDILARSTDARGRRFRVTEVVEADLRKIGADRQTRKDVESGREDYPALTYVNYLVVNDGVVFPQFGDRKADKAALRVIQDAYPDREIEPVYIYELPFYGGGIHCSTQEIPVPRN